MKGKNKAAKLAARKARHPDGRPEVSKYASKGGPHRYEFKEQEDQRRGGRR